MTDKVFWKNPYQTQLETKVSSVEGDTITLRETIFYALSSGQESDTGSIGGYPVLSARKSGQEIFYTLPHHHQLAVGDVVTVEIDWSRRYQLMRLHFAAEVVLEAMSKELAGSGKIGAHISADKARIDFEWPRTISPCLPHIKDVARSIIEADLPIISEFSDRQTEQRYWEVEGFAKVPCGGTHLKRTGEVGDIKLKRKNIGKGKERVEITLVHQFSTPPFIQSSSDRESRTPVQQLASLSG
ncbi:MAG: hypothetical protein AB4040_12305 [Synechococcus sp.]